MQKSLKMTLSKMSHPLSFISLATVAFILLRVPSLFEQDWDKDEGIYEVIGFVLRHGWLLYRDIWDNKPPLLYLLYALFDGNLLPMKWLSLCFGIVGLLLFYLLAKKLQMTKPATIISLSLFTCLFATPLYEGNLANAENFLVPVIIGAYLAFLYALQKRQHAYLLLSLSGLLLGIAALLKLVAIFDLGALVCFLIISQGDSWRKVAQQFPRLLLLCASFALPLVGTFLFFFAQRAGSLFITALLSTNVPYISIHNTLVIPYVFLYVRLLLLVAVCVLLWLVRKQISSTLLLITLWLSFSIFNALLSQEHWAHYGLVFVASFSLFAGICLTQRKARKWLLLGFLIACYLMSSISTINILIYYRNYSLFLTDNVSTFNSQLAGTGEVMPGHAVVSYLQHMSKPTESVLIWSDYTQRYRLLDRLPPGSCVAAFQYNNSQQTCTIVMKIPPRLVVILPQTGSCPYSLAHYTLIKDLDGTRIYELSSIR